MAAKVLERGIANEKVADAYSNTAASYGGSEPSGGDNTIKNVPCDVSVIVGSVVRMNGNTAINAVADSTVNSMAIGVCVRKNSSTSCDIQTCGYTDSLLAGLTIGVNYFLSDTTPGQLTTTIPTGTGKVVLYIGRAYKSQQFVINIGPQIRRA